ncbi:MAG TPA: putative porin [Pyrinomonadaceae bacterium]|nr:putative porin [Pyrinomonadaceae bacterium]
MKKTPARALLLSCALAALSAAPARAQASADTNTQAAAATADAPAKASTGTDASSEVLRQLREQRDEIERLRLLVEEQTRLMGELRTRVERSERLAAAAAARPAPGDSRDSSFAGALHDKGDPARIETAAASAPVSARAKGQGAGVEERVVKIEEGLKKTSETVARQLGSMTFSGDLRLRYESIYGQQNALANPDAPGTLGNPLTSRQRFRVRARFGVRGQIGKEFEWGLRLATGNQPDVISENQTLTDFFSRKTFALDQAYITYRPARLDGRLQLQAGKFDVPWLRTEMTIDNDLGVEGFHETYTYTFKDSDFKSVAFTAWQLPFLERNSAFVLGADGRVDLEQSRRGGRDLALYGAQLRTRFDPTKNTALTFAAADLYFSGTQFITPAQVFGTNIQVPVTVTIPATATTPAQTVTGLATVPRDFLVSGNANLGVSVASNNATNRDGRLSSGFNLVDLIGRFDYLRHKRLPFTALVNYVRNTQAHDVVLAGTGGLNRVLPNDENQGVWVEFQLGKDLASSRSSLVPAQERVAQGDYSFNYTFVRVEKDAVLTPFNFSDFNIQSDMSAHRFSAAYVLAPGVTVAFTGYVTSRLNGLLGPFATTPLGSLDRPTKRFQLDTLFRF